MAKGIETLAGPVSENDIIMRENEAPVGAAALMNKQVRKNTPGFYKLPSQDEDMPEFMKAAKAGVDKRIAQGDSINVMAGALMRQGVDVQGMNQDQIIMLYEQMMGSPGDRDQFGISENKYPNNFADDEGGILVLPRNLRTAPDVPETTLAYITDDEKALLGLLKPGTPHKGPEGVPSYDSLDYVAAPSKPQPKKEQGQGGATQSSFDAVAQGGGTQQQQDFVQQFQQSDEGKKFMENVQKDIDQGASSSDIENIIQGMDVRTGVRDKDDTSMGNLQLANFAKNILTSDDPQQALLDSDQYKKILAQMDQYDPLTGNIEFGMPFNMIAQIFDKSKMSKDRKRRLNEEGEDIGFTKEGVMDAIGNIKGGRDTFFNLIKRLDPENFYKVVGMPQTSGGLQELASNQFKDTTALAKEFGKDSDEYKSAIKFNRQIDEARQTIDREKGDKPQQSGGGVAPPVAPPDTTPDPDDDAYKFNVGGTMPYKDDVYTGGQEMDVPIGRRFALDKTGQLQTSSPTPDDMMQYATTGAYSQLEPFSNYIKRRRKFLGEEEPEYFDEEGNIIYSGVA